ncbi:MAG: hypothetical protein KDC18_16860 [Alphaproteobacteria bacterium]|nr:hypothetical protein [Alphaproteobacteria bacterium]MCB9930371.1 hypothetical protein [Alphaproteobacteria bacterium]
MARDAILSLERLNCAVESDASGGSEPYVWPALIRIDDLTLQTPELVGIVAPSSNNARLEIASDMRAGQSAPLPAGVSSLRVRLEDGLAIQQLVLAVTLWEHDETPDGAMKAGFNAYVATLRSAIADNLFALNSSDEDEVNDAIERIKLAVKAAVRSAIENALSGWEKARVFIGTLNLDDVVGTDFHRFEVTNGQTFELSFQETRNDRLTQSYTLAGTLHVRPVPIELCPEQLAQVKAARDAVAGVDAEIRATQAELVSAPPALKPFLVSEIRRLRTVELPAAQAALEAAQAALEACRNRFRDRFEVLAGRPEVILETVPYGPDPTPGGTSPPTRPPIPTVPVINRH